MMAKQVAADERLGMRYVPGGAFSMGSEQFYPEEAPVRRVRVDGFWIDEAPVTNRQFAAFVDARRYRTVAEIPPDPKIYGILPEMAVAGSLVFQRTTTPVPLHNHHAWWSFCEGASWRHPTGPGSGIADLLDHPVVHVAHADAVAYAKWAGKSLPTEAEWEYAARGGHDGREYAWGDMLEPDGAVLANYWRGLFPFANQRADGQYRTTAVGGYPANGHGLYDMIGNVWEWTADWYADPAHLPANGRDKGPCCTVQNPRGGTLRDSLIPGRPARSIGRKVLKGGSHLCAANYCERYRPAARTAQMIDSSTSHIGFRCVMRTGSQSVLSGKIGREGPSTRSRRRA